jgi:hypothetical protein
MSAHAVVQLHQRGVIQNRDRRVQVADMSGLRFGKITPTDIDAAIEYQDRCYIFIEGKYGGAPVPFGQKLFIERLVDRLSRSVFAVGVIADHYTPSHEDIMFDRMIVREIRYKGRWVSYGSGINVRQLCESAMKTAGISRSET